MTDPYWLQNATSLAMDALLARLDLEQGARPYFWVDYEARPPQAQHSYWDSCDIAGRFVDGLVLARLITGRQDAPEAEAQLRRFLWDQQDARDGLFYQPDDEQLATNAEMSKYIPAAGVMTSGRHLDFFCQRSPLLAMTTLLQMGDESMRPRLEKMVRGLWAIAERQGDEVRFPTYRWAPTLKPEWAAPANVPEKWLGYRYALLTGLARYAQLGQDPLAVDLALGITRHYLRHGDVPPDGRFRANTHSGGVLPVTVGVARLGMAFGEPELVAWANRVYQWTKENTPDFGFLRDGLGLEGFWSATCETCGIADFIHLAMLLTEAGVGEYWDDIERIARNQLLANQYRDEEAMRRLFPGVDERVLAMLKGGFECAARPNDLLTWKGAEGCCIGGGLRALYLTWRSSLSETDTETRVHTGVSRHTAAVRVKALEPGEGRLEVEVLRRRRLAIRLPAYTTPAQSQAWIDAGPVAINWERGYALFPELQPGQTAALTYPLPQRRQTYSIAGNEYTADWQGNVLVEISPPGSHHPTYCRRPLLDAPPSPGPAHPWQERPAPILW